MKQSFFKHLALVLSLSMMLSPIGVSESAVSDVLEHGILEAASVDEDQQLTEEFIVATQEEQTPEELDDMDLPSEDELDVNDTIVYVAPQGEEEDGEIVFDAGAVPEDPKADSDTTSDEQDNDTGNVTDKQDITSDEVPEEAATSEGNTDAMTVSSMDNDTNVTPENEDETESNGQSSSEPDYVNSYLEVNSHVVQDDVNDVYSSETDGNIGDEHDLDEIYTYEAQSEENGLILDSEAFEMNVFSLSEAGYNFEQLSNDTTFTVQGKSISASQINVQDGDTCWPWASRLYTKIWGVSFDSSFDGEATSGHNILRNLRSDSDRILSVENLQKFIGASELGASIRITKCNTNCSNFVHDSCATHSYGHNVILVAKDSNGLTVMDYHRADGTNYTRVTRYYTWQEFVNYWKNYTYIKYIKWPYAPVYTGAPITPADNLKFTNVAYPKTYFINNRGWDLGSGMLESNYDLQSLKTEIVSSSGTVISSFTRSISGKAYSIRSLDTYETSDNGVHFSWIKTAGNYKWILTAKDSGNRVLTMEMPFTAVTSGSISTATMSKEYEASSTTPTTTNNTSSTTPTTTKNIPTLTVTKSGKKYKAKLGLQIQLKLNGKQAKSYKSSKPKIVSVSSTGLLTIKAIGKAKITITLTNKKKLTLQMRGYDPTIPTKVSLSIPKTTIASGGSITLTPVIPSGTNTTYTWKTSNKRVATVTNGTVKFNKKGKVTITCITNRGKKKAKVTFRVKK